MAFDYSSTNRRWRALREQALRRDRFMCRESARYGRMIPADTVHHVWPAEEYPEYAYCLWNLISLSLAAHNEMHDRQTNEITELGRYWQRRTIPPGGTR